MMSTSNCYYFKSFHLEVNLQILFKPLTFHHDQKWYQCKFLSHLLWCWATLCSLHQAPFPKWLSSFGTKGLCVPGMSAWICTLGALLINFLKRLDTWALLLFMGSGAFWVLCTLISSRSLASLLWCYFFLLRLFLQFFLSILCVCFICQFVSLFLS